jgi:3-(3-hydroxy-phenyl)propionate hydroxylase
MYKKDISIIGAGPVGLTLAYLLAKNGISVRLFEKQNTLQKDYRASTFHAGTLDLFEESGITQALMDRGIVCPDFQYRGWAEGKIAQFNHSIIGEFTRHPFRLQCEQFKLSEFLFHELSGMSNVEIFMNRELIGLSQNSDLVSLEFKHNGNIELIQSDWVIGTDGGRSATRKCLGLEFKGFTYDEKILVLGTPYDMRKSFKDLSFINYFSDPVNYAHMLKIPDLWRMSLPLPNELEDDIALSNDYIDSRLHTLIPDLTSDQIQVKGVYHVHQRVVDRYQVGRVFLAGDAAHLNNPKGGMGLNGGLHDAMSLSRLFFDFFFCDKQHFEDYELQRRNEAIHAIHHQTQSNYTALKESDEIAREKLFNKWRSLEANENESKLFLLNTTMISSLWRCGLLERPINSALLPN